MTPQARAERSAAAMWAADRASQGLGMTLTRIAPGTATFTLRVRDDMLNGHNLCHGGFIFALADSAFAFACNSYNQNAVAQNNQITYVAPANAGELLAATATEIYRSDRSGIYDVTVSGDMNRTVALFRGHSRTIAGTHFEEPQ
ncbi:MAG: hydroxyphenylacetyl-CoA thioesterase PaaI [Pseudomonadota bacterium]